MKRIVLLLILCVLSLGISAQSQNHFKYKSQKQVQRSYLGASTKISSSHKETKFLFSIYTGGTPIVFPLVYESDPCLSLMLVSNDSINLAIDKAYIVDATGDDFRFNRDIHSLDSVKCFIDVDGGYSKMIAVVSRKGIQREFEIDGFLYHKILEINNRRTKFKANVTIPIIRIAAERIGNE